MIIRQEHIDPIQFISSLPLPEFVFVGTLIEEFISPIPAFLVLVPAGVSACMQGLGVWHIIGLALLSGVARIIAGSALYWLTDKFEDVLFANNRRLLGMTHKDIERTGRQFGNQRHAFKTWVVLFLMHATPIFPGAMLSVVGGFIKLPFGLFVSSTFFGSTVCALFYLWLGYAGLQATHLLNDMGSVSYAIGALLAIAAVVVWVKYRRKPRKA